MAVTSLWHIKGDLKDLVNYVENPDKTVLREMSACGHKPLLMKALERIFS